MNIGFYRYSLFNRGGDRIVVQYANHLASSGNKVSLHVRKIDSVFWLDPRIRVVRIPYPGKIGAVAYGGSHALGHDIVVVDIIHMSSLLSRRNNVMYFAQADDMEYYKHHAVRKLIDILYRRYFRTGRPIITVSETLSNIFKERYGFNNSSTVTNGIDLDTFYPEPDAALLSLKAAKKAVFLMSRGDRYRKGQDLAVQVLNSIEREFGNEIELWVCGDRLKENFSFTVRQFGAVSDSRLRQILSSADIFFYPSRFEGFGLFPLEAMACGCVVLTTDAVPYAAETKCISTAPKGDVAAFTRLLREMIMNQQMFEEMRKSVISEAEKYDFKYSTINFENTLKTITSQLA